MSKSKFKAINPKMLLKQRKTDKYIFFAHNTYVAWSVLSLVFLGKH